MFVVIGVVVVAEGVLASLKAEVLLGLALEVPQLILKLKLFSWGVSFVELIVVLLH
jgi:hypothetical protein